jgi:hypothetical protein
MRSISLFVLAAIGLQAQAPAELDPLTSFLNANAQRQLVARKAALSNLKTRADLEARQKQVRQTILKLIGGLPTYSGPLNAKVTATRDQGAFLVENLYFESLPNYFISANLYRPKSAGRHPAVLFSIGHWDEGKIAGQRIASNLAAKGFVVLAYDPIGQGERQQAFDPRSGRTLIGSATEQHFMGGAQSILAGQSVARYFIHDSRRALDYLVSRPEVDPQRIGATGCSGGGTQTTFISALDARVQVAAPACYMNSFEYLVAGATGDSEQSVPNFLSEGLDQSDWPLLFAPKPWLIASTEEDFFTPAGAKIVYEQGRNFYETFNSDGKIKWVMGPGPHGTPLIVREAIYEWMIRWLKDGQGDPKERDFPALSEAQLYAFPKGIAPGRGLSEIIAESWREAPRSSNPKALVALSPNPTGLTKVEALEVPNAKEAFLLLDNGNPARYRAQTLNAQGYSVYLVKLPGFPIDRNGGRLSGDWISHTRAFLSGLNLPSLRASDLLIETRKLLPRYNKVYLWAWGVAGFPALYAAHAEPRIAGIWLERTPQSLALAMNTPVHRNLHEALIPGLALAGDFQDFTDKRFFWVDPTDWNENILKTASAPYYLRPFDQSDVALLHVFLQHLGR